MNQQRRSRLAATLTAATLGTAATLAATAVLLSGRPVKAGLTPISLTPANPATQTTNKPITIGGVTFPSQAAFIAAGKRCGTRTPTANEIGAITGRLNSFLAKQGGSTGATGLNGVSTSRIATGTTITVPIYFHVITMEDGTGDVTDAQLQAQLDVMNKAYAGQDTERAPGMTAAQSTTANTPFRFVLAGTDRTPNDLWYFGGDDYTMKDTLRQGGANTLNVYLSQLGRGLLGYATFPWDYKSSPRQDGVVVLTDSLPGGAAVPYDRGDTLTHEAGHWFGLFHTFQGSCTTANDGVADTPAEAFSFFGDAPPYVDTCKQATFPGRDPVENFMDYGNDATIFQFTPGQASRAYAFWLQYRKP